MLRLDPKFLVHDNYLLVTTKGVTILTFWRVKNWWYIITASKRLVWDCRIAKQSFNVKMVFEKNRTFLNVSKLWLFFNNDFIIGKRYKEFKKRKKNPTTKFILLNFLFFRKWKLAKLFKKQEILHFRNFRSVFCLRTSFTRKLRHAEINVNAKTNNRQNL